MDGKALRSTLIGAAFLMATSAIGPGFLTQTAVFTESLGASFAFAILVSVIVQNVTEPKPALLHELPRSVPFGWE